MALNMLPLLYIFRPYISNIMCLGPTVVDLSQTSQVLGFKNIPERFRGWILK